ncbi:hypothetical protein Q8F55_001518 [Vanrija albida]|uniref:Tubby C-terminal-like domain-containing protein n=1 Tax=Vanrija albida TaxID=181172 RepID=A0ABR3QGA9_9TREE
MAPGYIFSDGPKALNPVHPPIGVFPGFVAQQPTTLVLKEKVLSWSGDDFGVKDQHGNVIVRVGGKVMSLRQRKVITDASGQTLFVLKDKIITFLKKMIGEDADGKQLFEVHHKLGIKTKVEVMFNNYSTKAPMKLTLKGDMWGGNADIIAEDGQVVAQIHRDLWNKKEFFADKQTYYVWVPPGVDLALISAVCIAFDEITNERNH